MKTSEKNTLITAKGKPNIGKKAGAKSSGKAAAGKTKSNGRTGPLGKGNSKKPWEKQPAGAAKTEKEFRSFLYLLPKRTSAKDLAKVLSFLPKEDLEVWEEECVLEISCESTVITFEDIRDSLEKEDEKVLSDLRMKQVLACDYESGDAQLVKRIMEEFLKVFHGQIGSDTEDFSPFLTLDEI